MNNDILYCVFQFVPHEIRWKSSAVNRFVYQHFGAMPLKQVLQIEAVAQAKDETSLCQLLIDLSKKQPMSWDQPPATMYLKASALSSFLSNPNPRTLARHVSRFVRYASTLKQLRIIGKLDLPKDCTFFAQICPMLELVIAEDYGAVGWFPHVAQGILMNTQIDDSLPASDAMWLGLDRGVLSMTAKSVRLLDGAGIFLGWKGLMGWVHSHPLLPEYSGRQFRECLVADHSQWDLKHEDPVHLKSIVHSSLTYRIDENYFGDGVLKVVSKVLRWILPRLFREDCIHHPDHPLYKAFNYAKWAIETNLQDLSLIEELYERDFEYDDWLGINLPDILLSRMRLKVPPLSAPRELVHRTLKEERLPVSNELARDLGIMRVMAHQGMIHELLDQSMDIPYVLLFLRWDLDNSFHPAWEQSFVAQAPQWQKLIRHNLETDVISRDFLSRLDSHWKTLKAFAE